MTGQLTQVPNVYYVPCDRIESNPFQPRLVFNDTELAELADSIREEGVLQPILVRPHPTRPDWYQLVSGERRWRACKLIERSEIPSTVRNLTDLQTAKLALQENIQRESLSDFEEARGIERLWKAFEESGQPMTKKAMARELKVSVNYISHRLDALGYADDVQTMMSEHRGVLSSAKAINTVQEPGRRAEYIKLVEDGKSFVDVTAAIQRDEMEIKAKTETRRAPEPETQSRFIRVSQGDSGAMSRGYQLTGTTKAEANDFVKRHARELEEWISKCDFKTYKVAEELARRIIRGDLHRDS